MPAPVCRGRIEQVPLVSRIQESVTAGILKVSRRQVDNAVVIHFQVLGMKSGIGPKPSCRVLPLLSLTSRSQEKD